jgi:hypothetical protein
MHFPFHILTGLDPTKKRDKQFIFSEPPTWVSELWELGAALAYDQTTDKRLVVVTVPDRQFASLLIASGYMAQKVQTCLQNQAVNHEAIQFQVDDFMTIVNDDDQDRRPAWWQVMAVGFCELTQGPKLTLKNCTVDAPRRKIPALTRYVTSQSSSAKERWLKLTPNRENFRITDRVQTVRRFGKGLGAALWGDTYNAQDAQEYCNIEIMGTKTRIESELRSLSFQDPMQLGRSRGKLGDLIINDRALSLTSSLQEGNHQPRPNLNLVIFEGFDIYERLHMNRQRQDQVVILAQKDKGYIDDVKELQSFLDEQSYKNIQLKIENEQDYQGTSLNCVALTRRRNR